MKRLLPAFCGRDCGGDACPLLAEVEGSRVERMLPNPAGGAWIRPCAKGFRLPSIHYSPNRLSEPLMRVGERGSGSFRPISWHQAVEVARAGLERALESGGPLSIIDLSSAGSTGAVHDTGRLTRRFLNILGGCSAQEGNFSSNAAGFALKRVFGSAYPESGIQASALSKAGGIILFGANILEARLGSELPARLLEAAGRDVPVVSIDPRRTSTAKFSKATWLPIRPGTDCALMYSVLYVLDRDGFLDLPWIEARTTGFDTLLCHARGADDGVPKNPSWAESICGLPAGRVEWLASLWARKKPLCLVPGYSIQRTHHGEEAARLCVALQVATKNFGLEGASRGSLNNRMPRPRVGVLGAGHGENQTFPVLRWPDRILEDGSAARPRIRAAYSAGGNYFNQGPDIGKSARALGVLDFFVVHDMFLTPTAMMADLVLPVASPLQKEDIGIPWAGNYLLYKPRILPALAGERSDFEIFRSLARAFGKEELFTEGLDESGWVERCIEESEIPDKDEFKRMGIYRGEERASELLDSFCADPESNVLDTPSGKLELGWGRRAGFRATATKDERYPFLLITPKSGGRVHSQGGEEPELIRRGILGISPDDASALGVAQGESLRLTSAQGTLVAEAWIDACIMKGVLSLEEGIWHRMRKEEGASSAVNLLLSTDGTEESISCIMHGIPVALERAR
ncbi:MAG TPA: molybdopterin-dependent oxidoreductase [Rectinemataceae bacterium]